jgi:hypothetical protein
MSAPSLTAIHEAGHAIVAAHYGLSIGVLRLTPGHGGYFMSPDFRKAEPPEWAAVLLAGKAAMRECCPDLVGRDILEYSGSQDRGQAMTLLDILCESPAEAEAVLKQAERTATHLCMIHRDLILAVATELDRRGVLDGADVREIIRKQQERAA